MTIIRNIMDGVVFVDRDDRITLINPVAEELLGIKAFLAMGHTVSEITQMGGAELTQALVVDHAAVIEQREINRTVEIHHREQDLLYVHLSTSMALDYRGEFAGVMIFLRDITSEYKVDQLRNQYLSIVAHELRTPLTGIKTYSSMMAKGMLGPMSDAQAEAVESIREQSVRLEHQIDKLINVGHIDSNEYARDIGVVAVRDLVDAAIQPFARVAEESEVEIVVRMDDAVGRVRADRADLTRALKALLENAVKFTPAGGTVTVAAEKSDAGVSISVSDTGIGVDPRYQRRIFEKFFQVEDPLTRHHGGAGLGLFVALGVLEAHGSKIDVASELGSGAEFMFCLPEFEEQTEEATPTAECASGVDA